MILNCKICGKKFKRPLCHMLFKNQFCSQRCYQENKKQALRKGRYFNCLHCNNQFYRKPFDIKNGNNKFCSRNCYLSWQKGRPKSERLKALWRDGRRGGINASNWKGGITPINRKIRNGEKYKNWRTAIFERDDYTCQECNKKNIYLHAHHIKPFSLFPRLRFDVDNGITLCKQCHNLKPKGREIGKLCYC